MKAPVLTFACGECGTALTMRCEACEQRRQEEHDAQRAFEEGLAQAQRAAVAAIPGALAIETLLGPPITLTTSVDEDREVVHQAAVSLPWGEVAGGLRGTEAEAVASLREALVSDLRALADELESEDAL